MAVSYDIFANAFLSKISDFELAALDDPTAEWLIDGYMKTAVSKFKKTCLYDLASNMDDENRVFNITFADGDEDEIVDIISLGMVVQWLKPYVNQQELLQNVLVTKDFDVYSPAELLLRVGNTYKSAQKEFTQAIREYSYDHGEIDNFHI